MYIVGQLICAWYDFLKQIASVLPTTGHILTNHLRFIPHFKNIPAPDLFVLEMEGWQRWLPI